MKTYSFPLQPLDQTIRFFNKLNGRSVGIYFLALAIVSLMYISYVMEWYFFIFGIVEVCSFFMVSKSLIRKWNSYQLANSIQYERKIFVIGLIIRIVYVLFIYWFYQLMTDQPFEFASADSFDYHETAKGLVQNTKNGNFWGNFTYMVEHNMADLGYPLFLFLPAYIFGDGYLAARLIQAVFGAYTVVLIYKISKFHFDENTARIAAIFCMLNPILIVYTGMSLKETIMVWILVEFIYQGDKLLMIRHFNFANIAPMVVLGLMLFLFRTVLAMIAFLAVGFSLVFTSDKIISVGKKILLGLLFTGIVLIAYSGQLKNEIREITSSDVQGQMKTSMEYRYGEKKTGSVGNKYAKYATTAVFAPLIFTIPFPTMIATEGQEDMRLINGGNYVKNITSGFVILAMFMLLFSGDWRKHVLPLSILLGYLVMLAFTEFAHSLRFHIPAMPFEMIFAAYGLTHLSIKQKRVFMMWIFLCLLFCVGWNWFKLAGRGLA